MHALGVRSCDQEAKMNDKNDPMCSEFRAPPVYMCRWIMPAVAHINRSCFIVWDFCSSNDATLWTAVRTSTSFFICVKVDIMSHVSRPRVIPHVDPSSGISTHVCTRYYIIPFRHSWLHMCPVGRTLDFLFSYARIYFSPPTAKKRRFSFLFQGFFAKPGTFRSCPRI